MKEACYTLGVDFGTLSARAVLARVADGAVIASAAMDYPHGVITGQLPGGAALDPMAALADHADYVLGLKTTMREAVRSGMAAGGRSRPDHRHRARRYRLHLSARGRGGNASERKK